MNQQCTCVKFQGICAKSSCKCQCGAHNPAPSQPAESSRKDADPNCGWCLGKGIVDSGGVTPWGEGIDVACSCTYAEPTVPQATAPTPPARLSDAEIARKHFPELIGNRSGIDWNRNERKKCESALAERGRQDAERIAELEQERDALSLMQKVGAQAAVNTHRLRANVAESRVTALTARIMQYENDEASVCPEDVGFVEFIGVLQEKCTALTAKVEELERSAAAPCCKYPRHCSGECTCPICSPEAWIEVGVKFDALTTNLAGLKETLRELIADNPPNKFRLAAALSTLDE